MVCFTLVPIIPSCPREQLFGYLKRAQKSGKYRYLPRILLYSPRFLSPDLGRKCEVKQHKIHLVDLARSCTRNAHDLIVVPVCLFDTRVR